MNTNVGILIPCTLIIVLIIHSFSIYNLMETMNNNIEVENNNTHIIFDRMNQLSKDVNSLERQISNSRLPEDEIDMNRSGLYHVQASTIEIFPKGYDVDDVEEIFYHELGHYVWYEKLSEEEQTEYEIIYNNSISFVSDYAQTNVREDFAETYMVYNCNQTIPNNRESFFHSIMLS